MAYNIVFIILDQRVEKLLAASGYALPAMDALARHGVTFGHHYITSAMCTASRASFLTGQTPHVTGVIDQMQYSYTRSLDPKMPNMGSVLKGLGYKTAYFGKFEMDKSILATESTINYTDAIQAYGFDVFNAGGDVGSEPYSGFNNDPYIAGEAVRGLHTMAGDARRTGQPFFMVASLVNPHDIMYGNANVAGQPPVQKAVVPFASPPPPPDSLYEKGWDFTLPASLQESLAGPGMPNALVEYKKGWDAWSGAIPTDRADMWTIFYNYYLNSIADVDRSLQKIVDVMDEMDLWRDTAIVFTADHGEMGGAHGGMKGKGPFAYEENIHVPLIVTHPKAKAGTTCSALTSHLDLLPTFVGLTGLPDAKRPQEVSALPGYDFSPLLADPQRASIDAVRPGVLFNYLGAGTVDGDFLGETMESLFMNKPTPPLANADLSKRGFISLVFDGRYKFARFYAPTACNTPQTLQDLLQNNDVQLFDLESDPGEVRNLVLEPQKYEPLIMRMNGLLNELMTKEVGPDDCRLLEKAIGPVSK
ncbi:MAG TPA: sulfatase-like hydrolase/transferase [Candidatus Cybelea sp.]|jgi:arylsulfatase|nr:sulfatase-like hydrolase/transferase [Candidatus Cybelea sp.]